MDEVLKASVYEEYKKTRMIWFAIMGGMLSLVVMTVIFHQMALFTRPEDIDAFLINRVFLMIVFFSALLVILLKRIVFIPSKLVARIKKRFMDNYTGSAKRDSMLKDIVLRIRMLQIIIWGLADLIVMIGFVNYVLLQTFQTFLVYSVVGIYSMAINYPTFVLIEQCYRELEN